MIKITRYNFIMVIMIVSSQFWIKTNCFLPIPNRYMIEILDKLENQIKKLKQLREKNIDAIKPQEQIIFEKDIINEVSTREYDTIKKIIDEYYNNEFATIINRVCEMRCEVESTLDDLCENAPIVIETKNLLLTALILYSLDYVNLKRLGIRHDCKERIATELEIIIFISSIGKLPFNKLFDEMNNFFNALIDLYASIFNQSEHSFFQDNVYNVEKIDFIKIMVYLFKKKPWLLPITIAGLIYCFYTWKKKVQRCI